MTEKKQVIDYCLKFKNVYEDYPFRDQNWCVIRHNENDKIFAWIFEKDGHVWVNVKCDTEWIMFWRNAFDSVIPAYHLNKEHWNSIILDETIPVKDIQIMISNSYDMTLKKINQGRARFEDGYPKNLLKAININESSVKNIDYEHLSEDQLTGLNFILNQLNPKEKEMICLRFEEGRTYQEIAELYERSNSRIGQIVNKALRKLRNPSRVVFVVKGYEAHKRELEGQRKSLKTWHEGDSEECIQKILKQPIEVLLLSVRSFNALHRRGIHTVGDLKEKMKEPEWYRDCRCMGKMSAKEVTNKMLEMGIIDGIS